MRTLLFATFLLLAISFASAPAAACVGPECLAPASVGGCTTQGVCFEVDKDGNVRVWGPPCTCDPVD